MSQPPALATAGGPILVCAATRTEAAACRAGIAAAAAAGFEVLATGVGPRRAAAALARRLAAAGPAPALVVSAGFAGALGPGLAPLTEVTATALYRLAGDRAVPVALPPGLLHVAAGAIPCHVVSGARVLDGAVRGVGERAAADMESAALAEVAAGAGLPFAVLRLVTDAPGAPMADLGRALALALEARGLAGRAAQGGRAALVALRSPRAAATFLRETATWRRGLREAWRARARLGLPAAAPRAPAGSQR